MEPHIQKAELLLQQNRPKQAETELKYVLKQEPGNDYALALLGRCKLDQKEFNNALILFNSAIAANPLSDYYFYLHAFAFYQLNNYNGAKEDLQKAIELNPYVAEYFGLLGHIYIGQNEFEKGLKNADEALKLDPENLTSLNARSIALNKMSRTEEAIETMNNALGKDPENPFTHGTVGWNLLEKGNYKEAGLHFNEALRLNPGYKSAQVGLKETMKSRIALYRWFLQYSFWLQNQGGFMRRFIVIGLLVGTRLFSSISTSLGNNNLAIFIGVLYALFVLTSWAITPLANIFLLFHPQGKYALDTSEKWSARSLLICLAVSVLYVIMYFIDYKLNAHNNYHLIYVSCVVSSLGVVLGHMQYPIKIAGGGLGVWLTVIMAVVAAIISVVVFFGINSYPFLLTYGLLFVAYSWLGAIGLKRE